MLLNNFVTRVGTGGVVAVLAAGVLLAGVAGGAVEHYRLTAGQEEQQGSHDQGQTGESSTNQKGQSDNQEGQSNNQEGQSDNQEGQSDNQGGTQGRSAGASAERSGGGNTDEQG